MATTFTTPTTDTGSPTPSLAAGLTHSRGVYTVTAGAALVINDVIQMVKVPAGARIISTTLHTSDLDSNGTPLITLSVGDGSVTNRFINASTKGQTGGTEFIGTGLTTGLAPYTYTVDDTIDVLVAAAPATGATTYVITLDVIFAAEAQP